MSERDTDGRYANYGMYQARDESAIKETAVNMAACFMALHLICCQTMRIGRDC